MDAISITPVTQPLSSAQCRHGEMLKPESTALIGPILARRLNELEDQQAQGQTNAVR